MRKKIDPLTKIEIWFKKYQTTLSIFIPSIISLVALFISMDANKISKEQREKEKLPLWDYRLVSDSDLKSVEFTSLKAGFKIQTIEVISPEFTITKTIWNFDNGIVNLYDLEEEILQKLNEHYNLPDIIQDELSPVSFSDSYPIAIRINYEYENIVNSTSEIFLIRFNLYGKEKLIFKSLKKFKTLNLSPNIKIAQELIYINRTQCLGKSFFIDSDEYFNDLDKIDSSISKYILLITQAGKGCSRSIQFRTTKHEDSTYIEYSVPALICDSINYKNFQSRFDTLSSNWSKNKDYLVKSQMRIDSFITENPFNQLSKNIDPHSNWYNSETFSKWESLLEDIKMNVWKHYTK